MTRVAFELDASCSFINASFVIGLGIEVEAFRKSVIRWKILPYDVGRDLIFLEIRVAQRSVVDLRVVDVLVVNVILDMYELIAIGLSIIGTLVRSSYPTWSWS